MRNKMLMRQKEKRVEHDRFGERDRENSVHEHLRERARISSDGGRHSKTGETDADSDAHRRETDVDASA